MNVSRRKFLKGVFGLLVASVAVSFGAYGYARYIEPKRIEINHKTIKHHQIPKSFHDVKIVQFSDTHLHEHFSINHLKKVVDVINEQKPDIIVFTGDLIDEPNRYGHIHEIAPILKSLRAPLGKFAIYGNHDHGGYGTEIYQNVLHLSEFHLLKNEVKKVLLPDGSYINIVGLDDLMLGRPSWDEALNNIEKNAYTILLAHEPGAIHQSKNYPVNLQLSGHSHGGQIKLPFIGPLYTPPYTDEYYEGLYQIDNTTLYVNRGLGTTRLPFRFLSVPEITVFTLKATT